MHGAAKNLGPSCPSFFTFAWHQSHRPKQNTYFLVRDLIKSCFRSKIGSSSKISAHLYRQNAQNREADLMDLFPDLKTPKIRKQINISANWAKICLQI